MINGLELFYANSNSGNGLKLIEQGIGLLHD